MAGSGELRDTAKTPPRVLVSPADPNIAEVHATKPALELLAPQVEGDRRHEVIKDDVVVPPEAE